MSPESPFHVQFGSCDRKHPIADGGESRDSRRGDLESVAGKRAHARTTRCGIKRLGADEQTCRGEGSCAIHCTERQSVSPVLEVRTLDLPPVSDVSSARCKQMLDSMRATSKMKLVKSSKTSLTCRLFSHWRFPIPYQQVSCPHTIKK